MSIADLTYRVKFDGDGSTKAFSFAFKAFEEDELEVVLVSSAGVETTQTLDTDFTVALNTGEGGTVTMTTAPASGEELVIFSSIAQAQPDSLDGGPMPEDTIEKMLDRATVLIHQLQGIAARAPKLASTTDSENPSVPEPVDGRGLVWSSGNLVHTGFSLAGVTTGTVTGIDVTTGASDAGKKILADAGGRLSPTFWNLPTLVADTTTLTQYQHNIRAAANSDLVITLPTSPRAGTRHRILRVDSNASNTLTILCGGANTMIDGFQSGTLYRLHKQYSWIELEWNGTNWIVLETYLVPDSLSSNSVLDQSLGTTRDAWVYGGVSVLVPAYGRWKLSCNGVISCETSTTDPVSLHVQIGQSSDGSGSLEERLIGRLGSDSGITRLPFRFTMPGFYTTSGFVQTFHLVVRANTVTGTPMMMVPT